MEQMLQKGVFQVYTSAFQEVAQAAQHALAPGSLG